jgi:hypothetical protein
MAKNKICQQILIHQRMTVKRIRLGNMYRCLSLIEMPFSELYNKHEENER